MATKLYLHDAANTLSGTFPSGEQSPATADWTTVGATTLRKMDLTIGAAQASLTGTTVASASLQRALLGMWVSPPLSGAQTVGGGNMVLNGADKESDLNANFYLNALTVYVWRPSTGVNVGQLFSGAWGGGSSEGGTSETVTQASGITSWAVSASDGDVVVVELWSYYTQSVAASYTATIYYDGTTENTTENAAVSNHASFLQLAETLTFQVVPDAKSGTDTLTPSVSDGVALLSGVVSADTLTPSAIGASTLLALLSRAATLTPALAEASTQVVVLAPSDAATPSLTDATMIATVFSRSDVLTPALAEAAQIIGALTGTDALTPGLGEAASLFGVVSSSDAMTPSLADSGVLQIPVSVFDTLYVYADTFYQPGVVREEVYVATIPTSRPIYKSKDWTEVVNDADPPPHVYVNYQFSNGRKFKG